MIPAYAAYCRDGPEAARLREEHLRDHLDHIERNMDRLLIAGPLKNEEGAFTGSFILFDVSSLEEAQALLEADPYYRAGIWSEVRIERFLPVAGRFVGGRNW
jgi:uncharacterized protein